MVESVAELNTTKPVNKYVALHHRDGAVAVLPNVTEIRTGNSIVRIKRNNVWEYFFEIQRITVLKSKREYENF